jgi:hypothetical protein
VDVDVDVGARMGDGFREASYLVAVGRTTLQKLARWIQGLRSGGGPGYVHVLGHWGDLPNHRRKDGKQRGRGRGREAQKPLGRDINPAGPPINWP